MRDMSTPPTAYGVCCPDAGVAGDAAGRRKAGSARLVLAGQRARESRPYEARPKAGQGDARGGFPVVRGDVHLAHRREYTHEELWRVSPCTYRGTYCVGTAELVRKSSYIHPSQSVKQSFFSFFFLSVFCFCFWGVWFWFCF